MKRWLTAIVCSLILLAGGCSSMFRFAPSENIKQSAELTNQLAQTMDSSGAEAKSPTTRKLVEGTKVSLTYVGRPKDVPDIQQFDAIIGRGQADAEQRPDVWELTDSFFELGIGLVGLFGGVGGIGVARFLKNAKGKSVALKEIVKGNETFKAAATSAVKEAFKVAQNAAQISNGTKLIVANTKLI